MVSATADAKNTQGENGNIKISTPANNDVDNMVQSSTSNAKLEANVEKTITSDNDTINTKKTDTTKKLQAQQETATNYDTLKSILTTSTDEELTVTLGEGTYTGNGQITVNSAIKTLTIDGNGQTINGNSMAFLKVENLDLTLKNIIITGCNNYDGSVLYQTGGQTTIINSTIKQNTLSSDGSSLGVIKVASGSLTLDNNTFDSNSVTTATTSRHGFIIHTTQTSKIINNIFINNDCNDEPNGYAGLINRLVDEIHDNQYINNNLEVYVDVSFLDSRGQVVIDPQANFERDIEVKLSKNVYNDTVRNGTLRAAFGDTNPFSKDYEVIDGVAHVLITRNELKTHHLSYLADELEDVKLTFLPLDNSYEATVTENIRIVSEEGAEADDIIFEVSEYNRSVIAGENITIKGNISKKTGQGGWNDDYTDWIDYTEPINDVLVKVIVNDKLTTCYARTNSSGDFVINCNATNVTPGQNQIYLNFKLDGPVVVNKIYGEDDELPVHVIGHTNITITAPDVGLGETIRIVTQVYNTETGNNANVGSTVNNKRFSITINDGSPKYVKISGGKYTYSYTPSELGTYNVSVTWAGTTYFLGSSNTTSFKVLPSTTNMTIINNNTIKIGQELNVHGVLSTSSGAAVKNTQVDITVGSATFTGVTVDGNGRYNLTTPINELGDLTITVVYTNHTTGYSSSINTSNVNVLPKDTNMTINNNESIIVGQEVTINGTLSDEFGEVIKNTYVNITVGSTPVNNVIVNENGFYETTCIVNEVGIINITVNYTSDNMNYTSSINTSDVTVIPRITNMTINNNESIFVGLQVNITGTLYDELGDIVPNTFVNITVGENIIKNVPVDENGNFSTLYQIDEIGEYPITVIYTNDTTRYYSSTNSSKVTVNPRNTYTVIDDTESVYIGQNVTIKGTLYDELDEIVPNTIVTIRIDENYINENVIVDDEGKFELSYNATSVGEHNITVIYTNDTTRYINSTNKSVFTVNPRTTNMTIEFDSPKVGEVLTVSGYLTDNLGEKVTNTIVNVTVGTAKNSNVIVDGNGYYETQFTLTQNGTYDIIVEYINHSSNYVRSTNTTVYELYKIPTITNVTVIDNTVYRVTIDVVVKADDSSNETVESGYLNITVDDESKLYPITGKTTRIILNSNVNITTTDEVDFKVEYVENDMYLNSTGINSTNDEVITKFTARPLNTNVTINVSPNPQNITDDIIISGQVIDEFGSIIQTGKVIISINGTTPETVPFVDGEYIYSYTTDVAGEIPFNVTYVGEKTINDNVLINESINSSTFTVNKIPTVTNVTLLNASYGNVTIRVNVTDERDSSKLVSTGLIYVYDFINGKILVQEYPVANDNVELKLPINTTGIIKLLIVYPENSIYLESNARNESAFALDKDVYVINVEKLPSITNVEQILSNKSGEVALRINVTNTTDDLINSGHVIVINSSNGEILGEGNLSNGKVDILLENVTEPGLIEVNVTYMGNDFYLSSNATGLNKPSGDNITEIIVTVDPSIIINMEPNVTVIGESVLISGNVLNMTRQPYPENNVYIYINDEEYKADYDPETGNYSYSYKPTQNGTYTVYSAYVIDGEKIVTSETLELLVNKINSTTTVNVLNNTAGNVTLNISVAGVDGNKSMTGIVNITVDGNIIIPVELTGEETIIVNLRDNITRTGTVSVVVEFIENDNYYGSTNSTTVMDVINQTAILEVAVSQEEVVNSSIIIINGTLTDDLGNNLSDSYVEIRVDNEVTGIVKTDKDGVFTLNYVTDKLGEIIVNATYYGDNIRYSNATDNTKFYVYKFNTTIELNVSDINYTQTEEISLTLNETEATGLITVEITSDVEGFNTIKDTYDFNGETIQIPLEQLKAGEYTVTVTYDGDSKYNENISSKTFRVEQLDDYTLNVTATNITYGENEYITVFLPSDAKGKLNYTIQGEDVYIIIRGSIDLEKTNTLETPAYVLNAGNYVVYISYTDDNYAFKTNSTSFVVRKAESNIDVNAVNITRGYNETIIVTLPEYEYANGNISVRITNGDYVNEYVIEASQLDEGTAVKVIEGLTEGTYSVEVVFTNDTNYNDSTKVAEFNVVLPEISIFDSETIFVDESVLIHGTVTDPNANRITGTIRLNINGTISDISYNEYVKGINQLFSKDGVYTVNATYILDNKEIVTSDNIIITVNKIPTVTTVTLINDTLGNVVIDVVVVENEEGYNNPITSGKINITVNGQTKEYDIQGVNTTIKLDQITNGGDNTVVVSYNGSYKYNESSDNEFTSINVVAKSSRITIDEIEPVLINQTVTITGQVFDEYGNIIESGEVSIVVDNQAAQTVQITGGRYTLTGNKNTTNAGTITVEVTYNGQTPNIKSSNNQTTFTVEKLPTTTTVELVDSSSGSVTINVKVESVDDLSSGVLDISVAGVTIKYNLEDAENGNIVLSDIPEFEDLLVNGNVRVQVVFNENDYYLSSTDALFKNITVTAKDLSIKVEADKTSAVLEDSIIINGTLVTADNMEGKTVLLNITGIDYLVPVTVNSSNGFTFEYVADTLGSITVNASFTDETGTYKNVSDTTSFTVDKIPTSTELTFVNTTIGNVVVNVKVTGNDKAVTTGRVVIVDSVTGEVLGEDELVNGERNITLNVVNTGELSVNAIYGVNDKYLASNDTQNSVINKLNSTITINILDDSLTIGDTVVVYGTVTDSNGKVIQTGNVTVTINGTEYNTTIVDGEYKLENITSTAGTYPVEATFAGNSNVTGNTSISKQFTVDKIPTTTTVVVDNNKVGNTSIIVTVTDKDNKPVTNGTIRVTLPDDVITTNITGESTVIPITTETDTILPITVEYLENSEYVNSSVDTEITVIKTNTTITVNVNTPVKYGENTTVNGVLLDEYNNPVTGAKVEIKVDGEVYANVTTDNDGKYNTIISDVIVGTHNVEAVYAGDNKYAQSTNSTSLTVEKLESKLTINSTSPVSVGENVEISGKLLDENDKPISDATVQVNYEGNIKNITTDKDGNYNTNFPVTSSGEKNVTATFIGDDKYDASQIEGINIADKGNATIEATLPDNAKVGQATNITGKVTDSNGNPLANMPVTVTVNDKPIRTLTDENGNFQVDGIIPTEGTNTVKVSAGNDNYVAEDIISNFTAKKLDAIITIDPISDKKVDDDVNITGKLVDEQNNPITKAPIELTVNNNTVTIVTDNNGDYEYTTQNIPEGLNNITVKYENTDYNTATNNTTFSVTKHKTIVTVPDIVATMGEDTVLTAYVTDEDGNPVSGGSLIFKLNGLTLRVDGRFDNKSASPYKFKVENGIVTFTMKGEVMRGGKNLTASYGGSYKYESSKANNANVNLSKRTAQVTVSITPNNTRQNNDIVFTATLRDVTPNSTNATAITTNASLIFKLNGITIKNSSDEPDRITVNSTVVNYVYHVPSGMKGADQNNNIRNYTIEALYDNPVFESDARNTSVFNIKRSKININFINTTVKDDVLSINATFTDFEDNYVVGSNKVCVKINGKTYQEDGKAKYFRVKDGKVDLTGIKLASGTKVQSVMLVTGDSEAYQGARATTTDIVVM